MLISQSSPNSKRYRCKHVSGVAQPCHTMQLNRSKTQNQLSAWDAQSDTRLTPPQPSSHPTSCLHLCCIFLKLYTSSVWIGAVHHIPSMISQCQLSTFSSWFRVKVKKHMETMIQLSFEGIWCHQVGQLCIATTCPSVVAITATGPPKEPVFWLLLRQCASWLTTRKTCSLFLFLSFRCSQTKPMNDD